jgi:hypothetical protein
MKKHVQRLRSTCALIVSVLAITAAGPASAAAGGSARIEPYLMASQQQEIALARSAAPASISMHATVMVLSAHGYVTAVKGNNGFVCVLSRSWDGMVSMASARFWNPKISVPKCFNAGGARSMLAELLMKTQWVAAGASEAEIGERLKAAWAAGKIENAPAGAACYMMSKRSWGVGGQPGAWRPHLMFYFPNGEVSKSAANFGANLDGTPVLSDAEDEHTTVVFVLVPVWSDGSPAPSM